MALDAGVLAVALGGVGAVLVVVAVLVVGVVPVAAVAGVVLVPAGGGAVAPGAEALAWEALAEDPLELVLLLPQAPTATASDAVAVRASNRLMTASLKTASLTTARKGLIVGTPTILARRRRQPPPVPA